MRSECLGGCCKEAAFLESWYIHKPKYTHQTSYNCTVTGGLAKRATGTFLKKLSKNSVPGDVGWKASTVNFGPWRFCRVSAKICPLLAT